MDLEAIETDEDVDQPGIGEIRSGRQRVKLCVEAHLLAARRTRRPVPLLHGLGVAAETVTLTNEFPHSLWPFEPLLSLVAERLWDQFEVGKRLTRHDRIVHVENNRYNILQCRICSARIGTFRMPCGAAYPWQPYSSGVRYKPLLVLVVALVVLACAVAFERTGALDSHPKCEVLSSPGAPPSPDVECP
ncbi:MAG: hypothetical protein QOJ67_4187 [Acidimicrobiaceae bacterium]